MTIRHPTALAGLLVPCVPSATATAAPSASCFEPVKAEVTAATGAGIGVRLVSRPTGKPVAGAVLIRPRHDTSGIIEASVFFTAKD